MIADRIAVIDVDSHVSEPPDLWTARLASKWADIAPRVEMHPDREEEFWLIGDRRVSAAWAVSVAGWKEWMPSHPRVQSEVDPAAYDPVARAQRLDEFGIAHQVLYPNILGFHLQALLATGDSEFHLACVAAYNDFLSDFADSAPGRFIPVMALPFWDVEAAIVEVERSAARGHKGVLFANQPERIGLPRLRDPHWDPLWAACENAGLPINFHVGFGTVPAPSKQRPGDQASAIFPADPVAPKTAAERTSAIVDLVKFTTLGLMSNSTAVVEVILSGLLDRFPRLNWVSVESGFGYLPYLIETLDWQWLNTGAARALPDRLMPSEYFRRQVYGTFWFERESLGRLVDLYPDNVMFESDFPHPTSLSPGPCSYTGSAKEVIEQNLSHLPDDLVDKLVHGTAARVYGLDSATKATV